MQLSATMIKAVKISQGDRGSSEIRFPEETTDSSVLDGIFIRRYIIALLTLSAQAKLAVGWVASQATYKF